MQKKAHIDKRVLKTRDALNIAFTELLNEKPFEEITVKELSSRAHVNRATFYSHFASLDEMAHAFRMARVDNILDIVEVHKDDIINRHEVRFTLDLYSYFYEDRDIFRIILCENRDPLFGRALIETAHARFNPIRLFDEQGEDQASLLAIVCDQQFDFLIGGLLTIADNWLAEKNEATVEEVAICAADFLHACSNKTTLKCLKELLKNQDNPEMMKVIGDTNAKRLRRKRSDTTLYSTRLS